MSVRSKAAAYGALVGMLWTSRASAQGRPRFEPTDVEFEAPGVMELDVQVGAMLARQGHVSRLMAPDYELDLGLLPRVELDLDGAVRVDRGPSTLVVEPTWVAAKLRLHELQLDDGLGHASLALQLGPRLPGLRSGAGLGFAGLVLLGQSWQRLHSVVNVGAIVDPGPEITGARPRAVLLGLDATVDLGAPGTPWALVAQLASAVSLGADPHEMHGTIGVAWSPDSDLTLSCVGLAGSFASGDTAGLLLGVSTKLSLLQ